MHNNQWLSHHLAFFFNEVTKPRTRISAATRASERRADGQVYENSGGKFQVFDSLGGKRFGVKS